MNKVIEITIRNKVARIASSPIIVGKNKDYIVRFNFDEDWDKYDTKTARFSQDGEYQDIIFAGNECSMPALDGGKVVEVGVYAGDISTTTPAYLKVQKSIIDDDGVPADPTPDVYAQLMERLNELEAPAAVLYTEQNLTDEQKAQARDNIGVTESLGMTGATVGQVPVVKTVDENGAPTEWEAGDSKPFVVTVTYGDGGTLTADKTHAEIVAAYAVSAQVNAKIVNYPGVIVPSILPLYINNFNMVFIFSGSGVLNGRAMAMTARDTNGSWRVELAELATLDDIPSGGTDTSLGVTGATVGQTVKIKAVGENGVPTAWEPADMPSGGGESNTFGKVVEMTTAEDAAMISISTDKNGNPLSMSEFYVAITTARNSAATASKYFNCNVLPDTVPSYIRNESSIKKLMLYPDVYCYVMHYKLVGGMIFHEFVGTLRTSNSLNVAEYLENETKTGIMADNAKTNGFLSKLDTAAGVSKVDSTGKMYCITFSADSTECIFGAGTRVEVWAR